MAIELAKAIFRLWSMFGLWIQLIDRVGQAGRFRGCKHLAEAEKLGIGQVPVPGALAIFLDALGWIVSGVHTLLLRRPRPNRREDIQRAVCLGTPIGHNGVEPLDVRRMNIGKPLRAELGQNVQPQRALVTSCCAGLFLREGVFKESL